MSDGFKDIDGPAGGDTGFDIEDYLLKLKYDNDPGAAVYQSLRLKAGYTDQISDETYLGLTDEDFAENPYRRYAASGGYVFNSGHEQLQLSYVVDSEGSWRGELTAYRNNFARNWFKLDDVNCSDDRYARARRRGRPLAAGRRFPDGRPATRANQHRRARFDDESCQ